MHTSVSPTLHIYINKSKV